MAKQRTNVHYVNNKEFLAAMVEYREKVLAAKEEGKGAPNGDGQCILSPSFYGEFDYMMVDKKELFEDFARIFIPDYDGVLNEQNGITH